MNNSNNNLKQKFHVVANMKMYFQKNIGSIVKLNDEECKVEISSKSDYVLLPDLNSMIINHIDLENDNDNELSINQSLYTLSSTAASKKFSPVIAPSLIDELFSLDSECEEV